MIKNVNIVSKRRIQPEPLFGMNITPTANETDNAFEIAEISDNLGIDLISVQDHPYDGSFFNTWTLITALAMSTKNIHFMTNVADVPLRHPPLLAKSAATLDILTKGRVELGNINQKHNKYMHSFFLISNISLTIAMHRSAAALRHFLYGVKNTSEQEMGTV
jgi:hypothetical protein